MNATYEIRDGRQVQTWPPLPVGCACRTAEQPAWGCVPEYDMPGVGAVVPLDALLAVIEHLGGPTDA